MKRILSGIQPSGDVTIGNYFGAIDKWVEMSKDSEYQCFYMAANMHTITVKTTPDVLRKNCLNLLAILISCGLDVENSPIFLQSDVKEHAELSWVLSCTAYFGEMERMTQFKDKSKKHQDNINVGLFTYPILMASDILLYQPDFVPTGEDQKQHLEITRDLAERFNKRYEAVFKIPEPMISKVGNRIMSLQNPIEKMSKSSDNENSYILLTDEKDTIFKKIRCSVTDSENEVYYSDNKPGIKNLMIIYQKITGKNFEEITRQFKGLSYSDFKETISESLYEILAPIQKNFNMIKDDKNFLSGVYKSGSEKARTIAEKTLKNVYDAVGFNV